MKKKRSRKLRPDTRLQTPPGHYLKNAPWREEPVGGSEPRLVSARDTVVLAFLILSSVAVAAALWLNPPRVLQFNEPAPAVKPQASRTSAKIPRPYNGLSYDPAKFEELREDDPMVKDDLEDLLIEGAEQPVEKNSSL